MTPDELFKLALQLLPASPALVIAGMFWLVRKAHAEEMTAVNKRLAALENRTEKLIRKHVLHHSKDAAYVLNDKVEADDDS